MAHGAPSGIGWASVQERCLDILLEEGGGGAEPAAESGYRAGELSPSAGDHAVELSCSSPAPSVGPWPDSPGKKRRWTPTGKPKGRPKGSVGRPRLLKELDQSEDRPNAVKTPRSRDSMGRYGRDAAVESPSSGFPLAVAAINFDQEMALGRVNWGRIQNSLSFPCQKTKCRCQK